jgi:plasmid maintenance system antidote protein VapI
MLSTIEGQEKVIKVLQKRQDEAPSQVAFARALGTSPSHLYAMLHGQKAVSVKVAALLGFERVTVYRRAKVAP